MGAGLQRAHAAARRTRPLSLEGKVQKAVDEILNENVWPIYKTQDDNGLEEHEYFEFAMAVARKANLKT